MRVCPYTRYRHWTSTHHCTVTTSPVLALQLPMVAASQVIGSAMLGSRQCRSRGTLMYDFGHMTGVQVHTIILPRQSQYLHYNGVAVPVLRNASPFTAVSSFKLSPPSESPSLARTNVALSSPSSLLVTTPLKFEGSLGTHRLLPPQIIEVAGVPCQCRSTCSVVPQKQLP